MPFSAAQLANIASAALDFHIRGKAMAQSIQSRPLLDAIMAGQKSFPGGKGLITMPVKGDYTTEIQGYTHNDTVAYQNPANIKRAEFPWKEIHAGISMTLTELKHDGISVVDSLNGKSTTEHSDRELTVLTGLLEDKLDDMSEGWARSMNEMFWLDGTQDAKVVPGILYLLPDDNTTGIVGGIDRAQNTWWRHRTLVGANKITASVTTQALSKALRKEARQLTRYGGKPTKILCGSGFLEKLDAEVAEKGTYTQTGFLKNGTNDIGMADISMRGIGTFEYDPTLDDLGYTNRCYMLDLKHIHARVMEGEDRKTHNPARPYNQYVLYRAMTWTGGLVGNQFNGCGVYEVAA